MSYTNYYPASGMLHASIPWLMGTRMDALLFGDDRQQLENVWISIEAEIWRIEKMLNRFDSESEVAKINDSAYLSAVCLSDELWSIMLDCRRHHKDTAGYFDVTWTDFDKIELIEATQCLHFNKQDMRLDFGGYGKGYALQKVRRQLDEAGIKRALINFGNSSVLALSTHPFGDSWPVSIETPSATGEQAVIQLCDASLSVSGNMPSREAHIINPKTAELITGEQMVAVISEDPVEAEALTTAWIASGSCEPPDWMLKYKVIKKYRIK